MTRRRCGRAGPDGCRFSEDSVEWFWMRSEPCAFVVGVSERQGEEFEEAWIRNRPCCGEER